MGYRRSTPLQYQLPMIKSKIIATMAAVAKENKHPNTRKTPKVRQSPIKIKISNIDYLSTCNCFITRTESRITKISDLTFL